MRLSGRLTKGSRSLLITTPDEGTWIVDAPDFDGALLEQNVIVEGVLKSPERILADWIGIDQSVAL